MKETFELIFWSALCNSIFIMGVYALFSEKMILAPIANYLNIKLPKWVVKPLYWCPVCMASFWGTVFFFSALFGQVGILWFFPFVVMVAGINFLLSQMIYE